ncbi:hypothetical protein LTS10_008557 [Elasticomyces elasticus]|nr:hypothetical protein LTS10_008557 [Elasticomyces elasticus]
MAQDAETTIRGLREQIKANATVLFPDCLIPWQKQTATPSMYPISSLLSFEIVVLKLADDSDMSQYDASLAHQYLSRYERDAIGAVSVSIIGALQSLLDITGRALTMRMANAFIRDVDKEWKAIGGGVVNGGSLVR